MSFSLTSLFLGILMIVGTLGGQWGASALCFIWFTLISLSLFKDNRRMFNWLVPRVDEERYNRLKVNGPRNALFVAVAFLLIGILEMLGF